MSGKFTIDTEGLKKNVDIMFPKPANPESENELEKMGVISDGLVELRKLAKLPVNQVSASQRKIFALVTDMDRGDVDGSGDGDQTEFEAIWPGTKGQTAVEAWSSAPELNILLHHHSNINDRKSLVPDDFGLCDNCGIPAAMFCSRCSNQHYCSVSCLEKRWKGHKEVCSKVGGSSESKVSPPSSSDRKIDETSNPEYSSDEEEVPFDLKTYKFSLFDFIFFLSHFRCSSKLNFFLFNEYFLASM